MAQPINPYEQPTHTQPGPADPDPRDSVFFQRNQLREVAWRIIAVVLLVKALFLFLQIIAYAQNAPTGYIAWMTLPLLILLGTAFAAYSASRAWSEAVVAKEPVPIDGGIVVMLQRVAFSIIGVLLVTDALPVLVTDLLSLLEPGAMVSEYLAPVCGTIIELALGIALFFGSNGLSRLWRSFRAYGHAKP
ncbi:MAG: hypothetical protein H0W72_00050 [Planctomycetes bacterium]|nr:hypothetical protein [Planctomycetota bacterium]